MEKPKIGNLIWVNRKTKQTVFIKSGYFAFLNSLKSKLKQDPIYSGGDFKLTYPNS